MNFVRIFFLLLAESFAKETKVSYPWNSTWINPESRRAWKYMQQNPYNSILGNGLSNNALLLLKQGLKIGYLSPTRYNCEFWNSEHDLSFFWVPNRLVNFNETLLDIKIGKQSVTWGHDHIDKETCLKFPEYGFFKRQSERSVLPHAIGCQPPSHNDAYMLVLQGNLW